MSDKFPMVPAAWRSLTLSEMTAALTTFRVLVPGLADDVANLMAEVIHQRARVTELQERGTAHVERARAAERLAGSVGDLDRLRTWWLADKFMGGSPWIENGADRTNALMQELHRVTKALAEARKVAHDMTERAGLARRDAGTAENLAAGLQRRVYALEDAMSRPASQPQTPDGRQRMHALTESLVASALARIDAHHLADGGPPGISREAAVGRELEDAWERAVCAEAALAAIRGASATPIDGVVNALLDIVPGSPRAAAKRGAEAERARVAGIVAAWATPMGYRRQCPECGHAYGKATAMTAPRRVVGVIVRREDGAVLLGYRLSAADHGSWNTPGGWVEDGEPPRSAAARELREETGIEVDDMTEMPFRTTTPADGEHPEIVFYWFVTNVTMGTRASRCEPDKCKEWRWFKDWPEGLSRGTKSLADMLFYFGTRHPGMRRP